MRILEVENLKKYFFESTGVFDRLMGKKEAKIVKAVDGVSFHLEKGETLSLVGESGSGKTTTGRLITRMLTPTEGKIIYNGNDITYLSEKKLRPIRKEIQMVFQDPYASLDPRMSIGDAISEPLKVHGIADGEEAREIVYEILEEVGLSPPRDFYDRKPAQLSGGQRQRAVIARAMVLKPKIVIADEPVSMIDVSMRISILKLLEKFKEEYGLSMIFITHDLSIAKIISDRIAVMYLGKIVEIGPTNEVLKNPKHPYTLALLTASPSISVRRKRIKWEIKGEIADPKNIPPGCRFHPRCPLAQQKCKVEEPLLSMEGKKQYACHYPLEDNIIKSYI